MDVAIQLNLLDLKWFYLLGETYSQYRWQLTPIFEDLKYLQLHHNIQLHIKGAPSLILQEVSSMATKAANFFVNVMQVSSNVPL
jgi:hypothetical protein